MKYKLPVHELIKGLIIEKNSQNYFYATLPDFTSNEILFHFFCSRITLDPQRSL